MLLYSMRTFVYYRLRRVTQCTDKDDFRDERDIGGTFSQCLQSTHKRTSRISTAGQKIVLDGGSSDQRIVK